jgi:hypothetical protein
MPLFGHRDNLRRLQEFGVPGLADVAVGQGWEPVSGSPFGGLLESDVRDITLALHREAPGAAPDGHHEAGPTEFSDAYRGLLDGRAVIVANAWTSVAGRHALAVCAVELTFPVTLLSVQPRRFPITLALPETPAGDPGFDERFLVQATADLDRAVQVLLTPEARQHILARDDWFFRAGRGLLGCIAAEPFRSVDEVSQRISAVLAIAAAMPAALVMPAPVSPGPAGQAPAGQPPAGPAPVAGYPRYPAPADPDPGAGSPGYPAQVSLSPADLIARLGHLASLDEALAMLQALTPAERTVLAGLDTPLSALAEVRTPEEATARYRTLDPQVKLRLAAMFMRPGDASRRR